MPEDSAAAPDDRVEEGTLLWQPSRERLEASGLSRYLGWLAAESGTVFDDYPALWSWSVDQLGPFWGGLWRYFGLGPPVPDDEVLVRGHGVEGARWFPGRRLNYIDRILQHPAGDLALIAENEAGDHAELSYGELRALAGAAAAGLRRLGVGPGDRVAAVLPNGVAAVAAFLATASLGAVWSACAPEFGVSSMVDRFAQIEPRVLFIADAYRYGGRRFDLAEKVGALADALPGLAATIVVPERGGGEGSWSAFTAEAADLSAAPVDFDHPLWILYSSGTTGPPKAIVQSHGGIVLEHLKAITLHCDLGSGDRFFWFSTTGWMMWNFLVSGLLAGTTIVCFDGHPLWPEEGRLFRLAEECGVSFFGTSAPFLDALRRSGYVPRRHHRLERLRTLGSTGAPLSPEGFAYGARALADDVLVASISGGTDVCTALIGSCPLLPVRAGEIQCRMLGAKVEAFDEDRRAVIGRTGELVVTEPMPSMPVSLWNDPEGTALHDSYFAHYDGVWRHGDWVKITEYGSCVVYGRSDATVNRGGVRSGPADFYRVLERTEGVADALLVDTSELGREGRLYLFVVAGPAADPDRLADELRARLRSELSPRHVPDEIVMVDAIPRTLNGKKLEVPIRRILLGTPPNEALTPGAVDDPEALDRFLARLPEPSDTTAEPER